MIVAETGGRRRLNDQTGGNSDTCRVVRQLGETAPPSHGTKIDNLIFSTWAIAENVLMCILGQHRSALKAIGLEAMYEDMVSGSFESDIAMFSIVDETCKQLGKT